MWNKEIFMLEYATNYSFLGIGLIGGFLGGLWYYHILWSRFEKAKLKIAIDAFNKALADLGISKNKEGKWEMKPADKDELWTKKE
jgi:hypothetical protein